MGKGTGSCARPSMRIDADVDPRHPYPEWATATDRELLEIALSEASSYPERVYLLHRLRALNPTPATRGMLSNAEVESLREEIASARWDLSEEGIRERLSETARDRRLRAEVGILGYDWRGDIAWEIRSRHPDQIAHNRRSEELEAEEVLTSTHYYAQGSGTLAEADAQGAWVRADAALEAHRLAGRVLRGRLDLDFHDEIELACARALDEHRDEIATRWTEREAQDRDEWIERGEAVLVDLQRRLSKHERASAPSAPPPEPRWDRQRFGEELKAEVEDRDGQIRAVFLEDSPFADGVAYVEHRAVNESRTRFEARMSWERIMPRVDLFTDRLYGDGRAEAEETRDAIAVEGECFTNKTLSFSSLPPTPHELDETCREIAPTMWGLLDDEERARMRAMVGDREYWCADARERCEWVETGERKWGLRADVAERDEGRLMATLYRLGATAADHELPAPDYESRHVVEPGSRLSAELPGGVRVHYVPHRGLVARREGERRREEIEQRTPMSERGSFYLDGAEPHRAMRLLSETGIAGRPVRRIPTELVYGGPARNGRIVPTRDEYAAGDAAVGLPRGTMVVHGMTGVAREEQAIERFERLVRSGGLKSIAERRRQGIGVSSMSPIGDIASGIDTGVPCKIGASTNYGDYVFFGMKPEVMERRDIWFAPRDFGASEDRYEQYNAYAKRIGQGKMHRSPSPESRDRHLRDGIRESGNEVYLRHEIPWSDVDTVFVDEAILEAIEPRIRRWRRDGTLPASLRVQPFGASHGYVPGHIRARGEELFDAE